MFDARQDRCAWILAAVGCVLLASTANAAQFVPSPTARMHTLAGQGTEYNTANPGGGIVYDSGTEILSIDGVVDVLNYYDPANGACPTDVGSNCAFNFGPDVDLMVQAKFQDIVLTPLGGNFFDVNLNFSTLGTSGFDITWDDGIENQLSADFTAGIYNGIATSGLTATLLFDANTQTVFNGEVSVIGFGLVDAGSPFASLYGSEAIQLSVQGFTGIDLDQLVQDAIAMDGLPSFTAEVDGGLIYRADTGDFVVPEPSTALLLGLGLAGLGASRRRG